MLQRADASAAAAAFDASPRRHFSSPAGAAIIGGCIAQR
jgi:hypothetical protein